MSLYALSHIFGSAFPSAFPGYLQNQKQKIKIMKTRFWWRNSMIVIHDRPPIRIPVDDLYESYRQGSITAALSIGSPQPCFWKHETSVRIPMGVKIPDYA